MTILIETTVPETGRFSIHLHADVEINISAGDARQRVTRFVHGKLSSQMHGTQPMLILILGDRVCWRVPVHLTFPSIGDAGHVGAIDVDIETGVLNTSDSVLQEIEAHAEALARRLPPTPTR